MHLGRVMPTSVESTAKSSGALRTSEALRFSGNGMVNVLRVVRPQNLDQAGMGSVEYFRGVYVVYNLHSSINSAAGLRRGVVL